MNTSESKKLVPYHILFARFAVVGIVIGGLMATANYYLDAVVAAPWVANWRFISLLTLFTLGVPTVRVALAIADRNTVNNWTIALVATAVLLPVIVLGTTFEGAGIAVHGDFLVPAWLALLQPFLAAAVCLTCKLAELAVRGLCWLGWFVSKAPGHLLRWAETGSVKQNGAHQ